MKSIIIQVITPAFVLNLLQEVFYPLMDLLSRTLISLLIVVSAHLVFFILCRVLFGMSLPEEKSNTDKSNYNENSNYHRET